MDQPRMFIVQSQQRARKVTFEGEPFKPWESPHVHSLPPPPDEPKAVRTLTRIPSENPNLVRKITPNGKAKWMLSADVIAEVQRRVHACDALARIARDMGMSEQAVGKIAKDVRKREPVVAAFEVQQTMPVKAAQPVCLPPSPEQQRLHVLAWRDRMNAYDYTDAPAGCLPRKVRKRASTMTAKQLRAELRGSTRVLPLAINCVDHRDPPARSPFD